METLWNELAAQRWGLARDVPTPGIIIAPHPLGLGPTDPEAIREALAGADPSHLYALGERQAIQSEQPTPAPELAAFLRQIGHEEDAEWLERQATDPTLRGDRS
jgi:hypothetical protein